MRIVFDFIVGIFGQVGLVLSASERNARFGEAYLNIEVGKGEIQTDDVAFVDDTDFYRSLSVDGVDDELRYGGVSLFDIAVLLIAVQDAVKVLCHAHRLPFRLSVVSDDHDGFERVDSFQNAFSHALFVGSVHAEQRSRFGFVFGGSLDVGGVFVPGIDIQ